MTLHDLKTLRKISEMLKDIENLIFEIDDIVLCHELNHDRWWLVERVEKSIYRLGYEEAKGNDTH